MSYDEDFRKNIHFDKNNPILAMKANTNRYTDKGPPGIPHLSAPHSEDALTWNIFRDLEARGGISTIENILKIKLDNPEILLWTLSPVGNKSDLQYIVGNTIRSIDGKHNGQMTEPDVVINSKDYFLIGECKLGKKNSKGHLWSVSDEKNGVGPEKREADYFSKNYFKNDESTKKIYKTYGYQLFRMIFYTIEIAQLLQKKPCFFALMNGSWIGDKVEGERTPRDIFDEVKKCIEEKEMKVEIFTWQELDFSDECLRNCINKIKP